MEWWTILSIILFCFLFLLIIGFPVAFSFLIINIVGVYVFWGGEAGFDQLIRSIYRSIATFSLLPVPLFILMGEIMFISGIAQNMMDALDRWLGRIPGRLGILAVGGGTLFSTLSGSAMAGVAMLGSVLVPEMEKRGYKKQMSIGPILASGGLAIMIPPSALAVLLASLTRTSVGDMLMAIIVPGILMAGSFAVYILLRCILQPDLAPSYEVEKTSLREKIVMTCKYVLPLGLVIFLVIGLMFLGIATPTESAATGVIGCFLLTLMYRGWDWQIIRRSITNTVKISVMMLMIMAGALAFSQIMAFSGASVGLVNLATGLNVHPMMIVVFMQIILLLMGCFMEPLTIMMVTLPIYSPIIKELGFDPIWFNAIMLLNMEMATTTPPFGMSLFVMKGVAPSNTTMGDIYKAGLPFLVCDTVVLALLMAFPSLVLYLPRLTH